MAIAYNPSSETSCGQCGGSYDKYNAVEGSFCSPLCYYKHKGDKLLNLLRYDHCECAMCGTQLKELEEPTDEALRKINGFHSTTCVVGYQYRTPSADVGAKVLVSNQGERVITGTICGECGSTNLSDEFPEMQNRFLFEYANGILETLDRKSDEHNKEIDREFFFEMLLATEDIAFSLGKAINE